MQRIQQQKRQTEMEQQQKGNETVLHATEKGTLFVSYCIIIIIPSYS